MWIGSPGGLGVSGREEEGLIVNPTSRRSRCGGLGTPPVTRPGRFLPPSRESHGEDSFGIVGAHFDRAAMRLRNLVRDVKSETEAIIASALLIRAPC